MRHCLPPPVAAVFLGLLLLQPAGLHPAGATGNDDSGSGAALLRVKLEDAPVRITGVSADDDPHWLVLTRNGRSYRIDLVDGTPQVRALAGIPEESLLDHHEPPAGERTWAFPGSAVSIADGRFTVRDPGDRVIARGRTLPDARPVWSRGRVALLTGPTESYRHGILGDAVEAEGLIIVDIGSARVFESPVLPEGTVFEARYPLWADMTGDGIPELLVTTGSATAGAAVRVYSPEAVLLAESDPIGTGYRWRHLLGTLPSGPSGESEIFTVRTPHIGGILESYRLENGRLERTRSLAGYSTHMIRSRNLGMAMLLPGGPGGEPALVLPTRDYRRLHLLRPDREGFQLLSEILLADVLSSNIAVLETPEHRFLAWGENDNSVSFLSLP